VNLPNPIFLGFDIGGTNIRGLAIRSDNSISELLSERCNDNYGEILQAIVRISDQIQLQENTQIGGIGIGVAGFVDNYGVVRTSPNLSTFNDFPILKNLEQKFDAPVLVENDATSATWAEVKRGAAQGSANTIMVCLGTGIGAGLYLNHELFRGNSGFAGEVGHITVVPGGLPCPCGRLGCWERYASGSSLGEIAESLLISGEIVSSDSRINDEARPFQNEWIAQLVLDGDLGARKVLDRLGYWLALGIANLVNIFDPERIVIGGAITELGSYLIDPVRENFELMTPEQSLREEGLITLAKFGNRAGAVGAALLAKERFLDMENKKR
tara:strand:- start:8 stop:988 length:981 start_codon:yes stop_codon:yes gene_type:complete